MESVVEKPQSESTRRASEQFRDSLPTVDTAGKRIWVYPKAPRGRFHRARVLTSVLFLAILFGVPFVRIHDEPLLLLNVFERHFVVLGHSFFPQDFYLFGLAMITFFVFIILFTVVYGRVWCGWACPQTLFMEMVFRKIEYWIEGDANAQRALDKAPWNTDKILKKGAKQLSFIAVSLLIAHTVMAYLIGMEAVANIVTQSPAAHWAGFTGLLAFTGIFYFVFARLREQVCTVVCPYGRLQSVLLTRDSMMVAYDYLRGEPRGKRKKERESSAAVRKGCGAGCASCGCAADTFEEKPIPTITSPLVGDCVDCRLCVQVCPTGIDIRNGAQLECINCTACIDACDGVMDKLGRDRGLIRIDSQRGIEERKPFRLSARIVAYSAVLLGLLALQGYLLTSRSDVGATVLRVPGLLYQETKPGVISNLYNAQLTNKTRTDLPVTLRLRRGADYPAGSIQVVGQRLVLPKGRTTEVVFFVQIPKSQLHRAKTPLVIEICHGDQLLEEANTNFLGPAQ